MAVADRPLTALLKNIAHELSDDGTHVDLAELRNPLEDIDELPIFAEFGPLGAEMPYYMVVPGESLATGDTGRVDAQRVRIHVVTDVASDEGGFGALIGDGGARTGLLNLIDIVEESLVRAGKPYPNIAPYDSQPYTVLTSITAVWKIRTAAPEFVTDPRVEDGVAVMQMIELQYMVEKGALS